MAETVMEWLAARWERFVAILSRLHKKIATNLELARRKRTGTKLAIVGPTASGKTVVHTFLATGVLLSDYNPTTGAGDKHAPTSVEIEAITEVMDKDPIHLYLAERIDVSGNFEQFPMAWAATLNDAFYVVFLFDAKRFIDQSLQGEAYRRLVVNACDFAGGLIKYSDTKVVFAGTHCDLIEDWTLSRQGMNLASRLVWNYDEADEAANRLAQNTEKPALPAFGSLRDEKSASDLLYSIFESES